jgi:hypothetical protein
MRGLFRLNFGYLVVPSLSWLYIPRSKKKKLVVHCMLLRAAMSWLCIVCFSKQAKVSQRGTPESSVCGGGTDKCEHKMSTQAAWVGLVGNSKSFYYVHRLVISRSIRFDLWIHFAQFGDMECLGLDRMKNWGFIQCARSQWPAWSAGLLWMILGHTRPIMRHFLLQLQMINLQQLYV